MRYFAPASLEEAINILLEHEGAIILAGGTDVMVEKRSGKIEPSAVVDIKKLEGELRYMRLSDDRLEIGSLTTITDILHWGKLPHEVTSLKDAARVFGCHEIRNRATIGGNIAHASPGAEFASTLLALDATVQLAGKDGKRELSMEDFFLGPGKANMERGEVITGFSVPLLSGSSSCYMRASRVDGMDLAIINCAIRLQDLDAENLAVRAAFGAVAGKPIRIVEAEKLLAREDFEGVKRLLFDTLNPRATSLRAAPMSKKLLAGNLAEDTYKIAKERLAG